MLATAKVPAILLILALFDGAVIGRHKALESPEEVDEWAAQALANPDSDMGWFQSCHDKSGDMRATCEVREFPYSSGSGQPIAIDGGENSGVHVIGWDRDQVFVIYRVRAR